jgi:hypothetical protein
VEWKIVIFFAPSGMLAPSRDRRGEEESAMKMGVPHLERVDVTWQSINAFNNQTG